MDKELDRMEGGGGRQQQAKGRPGERFTPRDKSKKRAQRDSKYGERCLVCTVLCCAGGGRSWGRRREWAQRDVVYGEQLWLHCLYVSAAWLCEWPAALCSFRCRPGCQCQWLLGSAREYGPTQSPPLRAHPAGFGWPERLRKQSNASGRVACPRSELNCPHSLSVSQALAAPSGCASRTTPAVRRMWMATAPPASMTAWRARSERSLAVSVPGLIHPSWSDGGLGGSYQHHLACYPFAVAIPQCFTPPARPYQLQARAAAARAACARAA